MIITYSLPLDVASSDQYRVSVSQGTKTAEVFVYKVNAVWRSNKSKDTSWASFDMSGPVTVKITKLSGTFAANTRVLPSAAKLTAKVMGNTVTFTLDRPRQVALDEGADISHPILIFANPLEKEKDVPKPNTPGVLYFGPGVHTIGSEKDVSAYHSIYLAGGAYVIGTLKLGKAQGVKISGRGILSGEQFKEPKGPHLIRSESWDSQKVLVEGITLINSPSYNITLAGREHTIRNVKMIGWWFSTDGVQPGENALVEDCFFKVNDDALKLYHSGTTVRRCTIWQMENGAPFQISWNMPTDNSGFLVTDCDVIRCEHEWNNDNEAIICAIHGGKGHMSNYVFENIRIENATWCLLSLQIKPNEFAKNQTPGTLSKITLRNVSITGPLKKPIRIKGLSATQKVSDVLFENVRVAGKHLKSTADMSFEIDPNTTGKITFL
ncbi:glycosyl hydrolase family 28 protein [Armatimonas sp.]|uniref:glycosyl hydrolase family 28 protein n=1 Tax=Armatimonas sp. TaxID=1872638 RepID=UPI002869FF89|nr:glycosyl hydrolase family 28 protein [Armatimonas sp.]